MIYGKPIWIRQVLVPDMTDSEEDLTLLKSFISSLKTVQKVEILPYHDLGKFKWENLGLKYPLFDIRPATSEDVERAKNILRNIEKVCIGSKTSSARFYYINIKFLPLLKLFSLNYFFI